MRLSLHRSCKQSGIALVVLLALIGMLIAGVLLTVARGGNEAAEQDRRTAQALALAKEALIAYAVSIRPNSVAQRPGDLPCPDLNNDGDTTLPEATCNTAAERIGRLPWKKLGLGDLRDGSGERLWYALSANFRRSTVNQCPVPGGANCLNSETPGTITVRDSRGNIIHDGTTPANNPAIVPTGAIAVVFAPGAVIKRRGASTPQDRSCAGDADVATCEQTGVCSGPVFTNTAKCNPANYLDVADSVVVPALNSAEDNANFADSSTTNGFIAGPVTDTSSNVVVNDRLIVIRYADLMPKLEQRAAREALNCLQNYAGGANYPWAVPVNADYTAPPSTTPTPTGLAGVLDTYFGRLPQLLSDGTSLAAPCPASLAQPSDKWWANWSNLVFYAIASDYAPSGGSAPSNCCLTINAPSATAWKVVVFVAGRPVIAQSRGIGAGESNYLEDANSNAAANRAAIGAGSFKQAQATSSFNDVLLFK